ncbi:MAG: hypothetical protein MMC33_007881 [Icmadophila ericetorum]|nr:hypothetical protein [Icmadophila ericetorum]
MTEHFWGMQTRENHFTKKKGSFSKRVLDSIPPRVKDELLNIVGKAHEFGDSQLHDMRKFRLEYMENKNRNNEEQKEVDYESTKLSIDMESYILTSPSLGKLISSLKDWFDLSVTLAMRLETSPHAEIDFLDLESHLRPQLFTLIDGNNIKNAGKLLTAIHLWRKKLFLKLDGHLFT